MAYPRDLMSTVLFEETEIKHRAAELAARINRDYRGRPLTLLCTLKGAAFFFADLVKNIDLDCQLEFIRASSYLGATTTTIGNVKISTVMDLDIINRDIIIVEDIVDTGLTCFELTQFLIRNHCSSIEICTMLDKPARRTHDIKPKYVGFEIPDVFIIGYGLDYNELYRNIPAIGIIDKKYI